MTQGLLLFGTDETAVLWVRVGITGGFHLTCHTSAPFELDMATDTDETRMQKPTVADIVNADLNHEHSQSESLKCTQSSITGAGAATTYSHLHLCSALVSAPRVAAPSHLSHAFTHELE